MFVAPPGVAAPEGEVVGTREIGGVVVTTVQVPSRAPLLRFIHAGFTIDLQVFRGEGMEELALEVTNAVVDGILCPSECGGLPDGADR